MNSDPLPLQTNTSAAEQSKEQGRRIVQLRKLTGLKRPAFCQKYNIPVSTMQNIELGRYQGITRTNMETLLSAFRAEGISTTTDYILFGQKETESEPTKIDSSLVEKAQKQGEQALNKQFFRAIRHGRNDEVVDLIKKNPSLKLKGNAVEFKPYSYEENSPLHVAAEAGHLAIVKTLLEGGCNVNAKNKFQQSPLHLAIIKRGYEEIVSCLILNGADVNTRDIVGETPLAMACYFGQLGIVRQLIRSGANINSKNAEGYTPLHWAAYNGFERVVKLLLENKAEAVEENSLRETPLMSARKNGHMDIVKLLEEY